MKTRHHALIWILLLLHTMFARGQQSPTQPKTIPDSYNEVWKTVEKDFTALAEAVPEDKWSFKPTQGAFTDVRTFAEQVKHVACGNEAWAKKLKGAQPPAHCDTGGPSPAKTKSEILAYLRESFALIDGEIVKINAANLVEPVKGPYWGGNRFEILTAALWHISDHYGQLVEYARMNAIVPPASR